MKLGVETGYSEDAETFGRLVREIDHPAVGVTLDREAALRRSQGYVAGTDSRRG